VRLGSAAETDSSALERLISLFYYEKSVTSRARFVDARDRSPARHHMKSSSASSNDAYFAAFCLFVFILSESMIKS